MCFGVSYLLKGADAKFLTKCKIASIAFLSVASEHCTHCLFVPLWETKRARIVMNTAQNTFVWLYKGSQYFGMGKLKRNPTKMTNFWGNCGSIACYVHDPPPLWLSDGLHIFTFILFSFSFLGVQEGGREGAGLMTC